MTCSLRCPIRALVGLIVATSPLSADVSLPPIFSDHMVLQKSERVPIWGRAEAGEAVTVTLDGASAKTVADDKRRWKVTLDLAQYGSGPFEMIVQGKNQLKVADVLIGEVWLASGQSNMAWQVKSTNPPPGFVESSNNSQLREFTVDRQAVRAPAEDYKGRWIIADPNSTPNFSAVAYYFGRALQEELKTPVGLINASWGGTTVEAWMRKEVIDTIPGIAERRAQQWDELDNNEAREGEFTKALTAWIKANNREDHPNKAEAFLSSHTSWTPLNLPNDVQKLAKGPGIVWIKREVDLPREVVGKGLWLDFLLTNGYETIFWNGKAVGGLRVGQFPNRQRQLTIPASELREGNNTLAIRIYAPTGAPQLITSPKWLKEERPDGWLFASELAFPPLAAALEASAPKPFTRPTQMQNIASMNYNGMIHPLIGYAIRGAIWYQGESNADRAQQYGISFPMMIEDWRAQWGQGAFPFYFCQLAAYQGKKPDVGESAWAELRESQSKALELPNTGQAVLIDLGEAGDIHPRNKRDVGLRLAQIALARDYGKKVPFSGPVYESLKIDGSRAIVSFSHTDGGLVPRPLPATHLVNSSKSKRESLIANSPGSQLEGFSICGEDRKWVWGEAKIEGDKVAVWSDKVAAPVAVRYAWATNPNANLYNGAGFPASPFRTDRFPGMTDGRVY